MMKRETNPRERKDIILSLSNKITIQRKGQPVVFSSGDDNVVYLLIDCSSSMEGSKLKSAKDGAIDFAFAARKKGYAIGGISFASIAQIFHQHTKQFDNFKIAVSALYVGGSTNMADALKFARDLLAPARGYRAIVLVTDGMPDSQEAALAEAKLAKKQGIDIITIGTDDADQLFLQKIASRTELAQKVSAEHLQKTISYASSLLMLPPGYDKK